MFRRLIFLLLVAVFLPASLWAGAPRHHFENRKYERPPRYDPRLKYLQSRKAGSCMYGPGICTVTPNNEIPYTRYKNSYQEKEAERRRRIRPWL